jgi:hypothetical protein
MKELAELIKSGEFAKPKWLNASFKTSKKLYADLRNPSTLSNCLLCQEIVVRLFYAGYGIFLFFG